MSDLENNSENNTIEVKSAAALRLEKARQAKAEKKAKEEAAKEAIDRSKTIQSKALERRKKSMHHRGPLSVPEDVLDPNFHYRWVEDKNWNMSEKRELGYEFVTDTDGRYTESDMVVKSAKFGNVVGRPSGNDGNTQYLMRIPKADFEEAKAFEREQASKLHDKPQEDGIYQRQFDIKDENI